MKAPFVFFFCLLGMLLSFWYGVHVGLNRTIERNRISIIDKRLIIDHLKYMIKLNKDLGSTKELEK